MYSYVIFFICIFNLGSKVIGADMDPFEKCLEIFKPQNVEMMCCENIVFGNEHWRGCDKKAGDDCAQPQCAFKKLGLMTPANSMNESAVATVLGNLEKTMPSMKPMTQRVKMYCLEGQYFDYAPTDESCDAIKFLVCAYTNSMVECTMWKKTDACMKLENLTKDCKTAIDGVV